MHAVQHIDRKFPYGARSCDLFTLARLPSVLYPVAKYFYVKVPENLLSLFPERIRQTAQRAIELREHGLRRYIKWFEDQLEEFSKSGA